MRLAVARVLPVAVLGLLAACGGGGPASAPQVPGLEVRMHDSPVEAADHVYVTVAAVEIFRTDEEGEGSKETLTSTPAQYDLLALQHGVEAVLGTGHFPPGHYKWIRLIVDADSKHDIRHLPADQLKNYIVVNGNPYPLVVPSGERTGIKLKHKFTITEGKTTVLTFDFNVRRSVHRCGHTHIYRLRPVIRLIDTVTDKDDGSGGEKSEETGSISGTVFTADGSAVPAGTTVSAQQGGVEIASVSVDPATHGYALDGLAAGTYDLVVIAPSFNFASQSAVDVAAGATSDGHAFSIEPAVTGSASGTVSYSSATADQITVNLVWQGFVVASVGIDPATGEYVFSDVPVDSYSIVATDGTNTDTQSADVPYADTVDVDLTLP